MDWERCCTRPATTAGSLWSKIPPAAAAPSAVAPRQTRARVPSGSRHRLGRNAATPQGRGKARYYTTLPIDRSRACATSQAAGPFDRRSSRGRLANVTDNDAPPGVTVTESAGSTDVTEGGASDIYDMVLDAPPSGTVTITISPDSQVNASPPTLTFTTSDWNTAQTVTVTAVDDAVVEGAHTGTITITPTPLPAAATTGSRFPTSSPTSPMTTRA